MRTRFKARSMCLTFAPLPARLKSTVTGPTRLTNNSSIKPIGDARREAGNGRNSVSEGGVAEESGEASRRAPRWRCDGCVSLTNIAIGSTSDETRCLRLQRLHIWHGLLHTQRLRLGSRSGQEGRRSARERLTNGGIRGRLLL